MFIRELNNTQGWYFRNRVAGYRRFKILYLGQYTLNHLKPVNFLSACLIVSRTIFTPRVLHEEKGLIKPGCMLKL